MTKITIISKNLHIHLFPSPSKKETTRISLIHTFFSPITLLNVPLSTNIEINDIPRAWEVRRCHFECFLSVFFESNVIIRHFVFPPCCLPPSAGSASDSLHDFKYSLKLLFWCLISISAIVLENLLAMGLAFATIRIDRVFKNLKYARTCEFIFVWLIIFFPLFPKRIHNVTMQLHFLNFVSYSLHVTWVSF